MTDETLYNLVRDHKELWDNLGDFDFNHPENSRLDRVDLFHRALVEDNILAEEDFTAVKQTLNMLGW